MGTNNEDGTEGLESEAVGELTPREERLFDLLKAQALVRYLGAVMDENTPAELGAEAEDKRIGDAVREAEALALACFLMARVAGMIE